MQGKRKGKKFHLGDILSITTGTLLSTEKVPMDGVFNILNFISNDDIPLSMLPLAAEKYTPLLIKELSFLKEIKEEDLSCVNKENAMTVLKQLTDKYGEYHTVYPASPKDV